ncbi:hypothetical protein TeGR_g1311 [Tetraparma gracilis]|uniref:Uncharacterized protein n=1 Tax=Tetraparma gracilis TaxID=2962635 RepID=A0ABQ6MFQ5_9STRA|nr:hypothetical protein TeGR_g1311 [Tetraparma gracilis]
MSYAPDWATRAPREVPAAKAASAATSATAPLGSAPDSGGRCSCFECESCACMNAAVASNLLNLGGIGAGVCLIVLGVFDILDSSWSLVFTDTWMITALAIYFIVFGILGIIVELKHFGAVSEWSKFLTRYFGKAMYYIGLGIISWRGDAPLIICSIIILVVAACFLFASFFHPRCKGFFDKNELGPD